MALKLNREQRIAMSNLYTKKGLGTAFSEAMSNFYRRWYVQGQADYRAGNPKPEECEENGSANEAWLMGWQADAEVSRRGLKLSDLGLFVPPPDMLEVSNETVSDL